jgi:hypothetical protein
VIPDRLALPTNNLSITTVNANMESHPTMNQLMDVFFASIATPTTTMRERYFLRESLHSLQRLTLSQHKLEMSLSVKKLIPSSHFPHNIKQRKIIDHHEEHAVAKNKPSTDHSNP